MPAFSVSLFLKGGATIKMEVDAEDADRAEDQVKHLLNAGQMRFHLRGVVTVVDTPEVVGFQIVSAAR
jgi:hypothetical protein